jgi:hypothetical protein
MGGAAYQVQVGQAGEAIDVPVDPFGGPRAVRTAEQVGQQVPGIVGGHDGTHRLIDGLRRPGRPHRPNARGCRARRTGW